MIFSSILEKISKVRKEMRKRDKMRNLFMMKKWHPKLSNARCKALMSKKNICLLKWELNRRRYRLTKESTTQMKTMNQTFWFLLLDH